MSGCFSWMARWRRPCPLMMRPYSNLGHGVRSPVRECGDDAACSEFNTRRRNAEIHVVDEDEISLEHR